MILLIDDMAFYICQNQGSELYLLMSQFGVCHARLISHLSSRTVKTYGMYFTTGTSCFHILNCPAVLSENVLHVWIKLYSLHDALF